MVNKQVFSSNAERENYKKLQRRWGEKYSIYHNLPFLNVFSTVGLVDPHFLRTGKASGTGLSVTLSDLDISRLKKTSIDYTLCDENDRPLVCIEFDGLQDGVNIGSAYYPAQPTEANTWREIITNLKLKVAHGSLFPFFVVGSDHFKDLPLDTKVTIVDGIIGEVLARRATTKQVDRGFHPEDIGSTQEDFDMLDAGTQNELIQDWLIGVEVTADMENNPVYQVSSRLMISEDVRSYSVEYKTYPELPGPENLAERMRQFDTVLYHGVKVTLHTKDSGDVDATVMLPNFQVPWFGSGLGLAEEIAKIMCVDRYVRRRKRL